MKLKLYSAHLGQNRKQCFNAGKAIAKAQAALDEALLEGGTKRDVSDFNIKGVMEALLEAGQQYRQLRLALPALAPGIDRELTDIGLLRNRLSVDPVSKDEKREAMRKIGIAQFASINLDTGAQGECRL